MKIVDKLKECTSDSFSAALLIGFLSGIIVGFLAAPIKKGISIGSNNNITQIEPDDEDEKK